MTTTVEVPPKIVPRAVAVVVSSAKRKTHHHLLCPRLVLEAWKPANMMMIVTERQEKVDVKVHHVAAEGNHGREKTSRIEEMISRKLIHLLPLLLQQLQLQKAPDVVITIGIIINTSIESIVVARTIAVVVNLAVGIMMMMMPLTRNSGKWEKQREGSFHSMMHQVPLLILNLDLDWFRTSNFHTMDPHVPRWGNQGVSSWISRLEEYQRSQALDPLVFRTFMPRLMAENKEQPPHRMIAS